MPKVLSWGSNLLPVAKKRAELTSWRANKPPQKGILRASSEGFTCMHGLLTPRKTLWFYSQPQQGWVWRPEGREERRLYLCIHVCSPFYIFIPCSLVREEDDYEDTHKVCCFGNRFCFTFDLLSGRSCEPTPNFSLFERKEEAACTHARSYGTQKQQPQQLHTYAYTLCAYVSLLLLICTLCAC